MRDVIYAGSFNAGSCFLIRGDVNVITDPGMAWCADRTAAAIEEAIGKEEVAAILLTHSHYDHVAALPYFRKRWPEAKVYAAAYAIEILRKPAARQTMRRLSDEAARENGAVIGDDYDEELLGADAAVADGDVLEFGDMTVKVTATPGHTRDSVSYLIDGDLLMSSESMGFINSDGTYNPQFLVSYSDARKSLDKSIAMAPARLCIPHNGMFEKPDSRFWSFFTDGIVESRDFMLQLLKKYPTQEERIMAMEKRYWHPERFGGWPREAYDVNAKAMLRTIARESGLD